MVDACSIKILIFTTYRETSYLISTGHEAKQAFSVLRPK